MLQDQAQSSLGPEQSCFIKQQNFFLYLNLNHSFFLSPSSGFHLHVVIRALHPKLHSFSSKVFDFVSLISIKVGIHVGSGGCVLSLCFEMMHSFCSQLSFSVISCGRLEFISCHRSVIDVHLLMSIMIFLKLKPRVLVIFP